MKTEKANPIRTYKTIIANSSEALDRQVNTAIAEGFVPYGNPYALGRQGCQALMIEEAGEPKPPAKKPR